MKHIKVLGSGCKRCDQTAQCIRERAALLGVEIELEKIDDLAEIARYDVLAMPSVVVDGVVVHSGGIPTTARVDEWLR